MEQTNSQTNDGNNLEERFELLSRQNQQLHEGLANLSKTIDEIFTVMMQVLKNLAEDKRRYREEEHVAAQTCRKSATTLVECAQVRARTLVESAEEHQDRGSK